jgi:photosystem II stability/assembly factor-like uncharacterized protein
MAIQYRVMLKGWIRVFLLAGFAARPAAAVDSCWLRDAAAPAPNTIYALCEQGRLWTTTDGGAKWSARDMHASQPLRALAFLDTRRGLAIGDGGLILATEDGGKTWAARTSATKEKLMAIAWAGEQAWASGMDGAIVHTADGGRTWTRQNTGTTQAIEAIFFLDGQRGWAAGWSGTILRTEDGGNTWRLIKTDAGQWSLAAIYFRDAKRGWAAGFAGQILRTEDGGLTWKALASATNAWLTAIAFDGKGRGWIAFDDGFLTSEDGSAWKEVRMPGRNFLNRLVRVNETLWAVGQSGILERTSGMEWKRVQSLVVDNSMREPERAVGKAAARGTAPER